MAGAYVVLDAHLSDAKLTIQVDAVPFHQDVSSPKGWPR